MRDDPRWISAKFAGVDMNGNPFRKGQQVLYYPRTKRILTGKPAEDAWRRLEAESFDEDFMGRYASKLSELIHGKTASRTIMVGTTQEVGSVRFHLYRGSLHATDLTNAGKRGKKVGEVVIMHRYRDSDPILNDVFAFAAGKNFAQVVAVFEDYAENYPILEVIHRELRGVDVRPSDMEVLKIDGDFVSVRVDHESYTVRDRVDRNNEPTCIPAANGKRGVPVFYRWVMENRSKIERMKYYDVLDAMHKMGIKYHDYCAMD